MTKESPLKYLIGVGVDGGRGPEVGLSVVKCVNSSPDRKGWLAHGVVRPSYRQNKRQRTIGTTYHVSLFSSLWTIYLLL